MQRIKLNKNQAIQVNMETINKMNSLMEIN